MDALSTKEVLVFAQNAEDRIMEIASTIAYGNSRSITYGELVREGIILIDELNLIKSRA